jgi:hypothetical protein
LGYLEQLQAELDADHPELGIQIFAVNEAGEEKGNDEAAKDCSFPIVQDTKAANVWGAWDVTWRDVYVLDADNHKTAVFNLTKSSLEEPLFYDTLKGLFLDAAE